MLLLTDDLFDLHDAGPGHPERPERLAAIRRALEGTEGVRWDEPKPATRDQIARVHDDAHVARMDSYRGRRVAIDPDTQVSERSVEAATLAAGAGITAVDALMTGEERRAFALVRPPGHHAEPRTAMGFCLFNNIAIAAAHARAAHGLERILVLDWDVHHGNGTQAAFETSAEVLFLSLHQFPFYPGTGAIDEVGVGRGEGFTVNIPLPAGCQPGDYRAAFEQIALPVADRFAPQLVLVSAGFDAHRRDPLAGMDLDEEAFASMAAAVAGLADDHADGRLLLFLEGGYDLDALGKSARACVDVLTGAAPPAGKPEPHRGAEAIDRVRARHRDRWKI